MVSDKITFSHNLYDVELEYTQRVNIQVCAKNKDEAKQIAWKKFHENKHLYSVEEEFDERIR